MPEVEINLKGAISQKMNPHFRSLVKNKDRIQVLVGGASSSKSYSTAQKYVYKTVAEPGHRILVVRKVASTIRHSCFDLLSDIISNWGLRPLFKIYQSELSMTCQVNDNEILFTGLDDVEKLKSIHGVTDIWIEEASELTEADFNQLDLRLRGETKHKKQITLTLNPISIHHWIKKRFFDRHEESCITHHSTYKDNLFLDVDTIVRLEGITDPYFKAVYVNGEWGVFGNTVFSNYIVEDFAYTEDDLENVFNGMDFGTVHASAFIRAGFRDDELYIFDEVYGKGWINQDFIQAIEDHFPDQIAHEWPITCDSAEADRFTEFERMGFRNLQKAKKGAGSLKYGIDYLTSVKIHIHERCQNTIKEIQTFKRREDKDGNAIEAFVEENDDCIAALRYGSEYIWGNQDSYFTPTEWSLADIGL